MENGGSDTRSSVVTAALREEETTQRSADRWLHEPSVMCVDGGVLLSHEKEGHTHARYNLNESQKHFAK